MPNHRSIRSSVFSSVMGGAVLGGFAVVAALLLGLIDQQTKPLIAANETALLVERLQQVLPPGNYDDDILAHPACVDIGLPEKIKAYRVYQNGEPAAAVLSTYTLQGYSGRIDLVVGIQLPSAPDTLNNTTGNASINAELTGVRATTHKETPGLGDKIEADRHPWILQFAGLSYAQLPAEDWAVKKDGGAFDQFTGATITPRAVVAAVDLALSAFNQHHQRIFAAPSRPSAHSHSESNPTANLQTTDDECR